MIAGLGEVKKAVLDRFGIKQPVFFAGLNWQLLSSLAGSGNARITELPRYPFVQRDLSLVLAKETSWGQVEAAVQKVKPGKLKELKLFDIFESEKLGADKKSMAVNFTFQDEEKTMTDTEIDGMMNKLIGTYEKELGAEIRK